MSDIFTDIEVLDDSSYKTTNNDFKYDRFGYNNIYNTDSFSKQNVIRDNGDSQRISESRRNSVGPKKSVRMSEQRRKAQAEAKRIADMKRRATACILGLSIAFGLGVTSTVALNKANDKLEACEYLNRYDSIVYENKNYNIDNTFWYDTLGMAEEILSKEDMEMALFAVYDNLTYKPVTHTSYVFSDAMSISKGTFLGGDFETFPEYVKSLGCIDKDGNVDYDAYKDRMKKIALVKSMAEEAGADLNKHDYKSSEK